MKKILSILFCIFLPFAIVGCTLTFKQQSQMTYEEQKALYGDIISQYTDLLTAKHNGEALTAPKTKGMNQRERAIAEALYGIVDACKDATAAEQLGYGYKDIDGNGTPELFLLTKYKSIRAIFTVSEGKPILLEANYGVGNSFLFATRNRFFIQHNTDADNIQETTLYICHVDGEKMVYDSVYGGAYDVEKQEVVEYFQVVDGMRTPIDEEAYDALHWEIQKMRNATGNDPNMKLAAPYNYFPLEERVIDEDLPTVDFSSYAAIRETYRAVSTCIDEFDRVAWYNGGYDDLFAFSDDLSFEYYNRLLYAANCARGDEIGYDEIDLNGDGQDELVLMNEDYSIRAIFTQKNGVPVLLDAYANTLCWLDDEGFIHAHRFDYYENEFYLYEFTKDGTYDLIYSILSFSQGWETHYYLWENGKSEEITYERFNELYSEDYCRYSDPFEPNEYTRNVSALTYTPLTEETEDIVAVATAKTWHKYARLKKMVNDFYTYGNTYVSFENVTETQVDVNIKYVFWYYYPDPDRENSVLEDYTESFLSLTARKEGDVFVIDEQGIKGRLELGRKYLWLMIDESADERFCVGYHCYEEYTPDDA